MARSQGSGLSFRGGSGGGSAGLVEVSHEVLTVAGQFAAVSISAQKYRWLELLFCGNTSAASINGLLEVNGAVTGFAQRVAGFSGASSVGASNLLPWVGGTCISSASPPCPFVWRITLALRPSGPHPYVTHSGMSNGNASSTQANVNCGAGQNTDTNVLTSVRVVHDPATPGTFSAGSSLTIFGMGVS